MKKSLLVLLFIFGLSDSLFAIQEGSNRADDMIRDSFSMAGDSAPHLLTERDRTDGLFITITNTTDKAIDIEKLELKKVLKE